MIFVTGPMFSGQESFVRKYMNWSEEEFRSTSVRDAHILAYSSENLEELADELSAKSFVTADEVGAGVVPVNPIQREQREKAGRLAVLLAERAETVVRVCCGIPMILKGELKCL